MMRQRIAIISAVTLAAVLVASGCVPGSNGTTDLSEVEVRQYQGEDLSSINDFRENSIAGVQHIDIADYTLDITGLVETPTSYTYDEVIEEFPSYKKVVTLNCVEGWSTKILWEGILVSDLLEAAGISPEAEIMIFHAYDGYTTSLPINYVVDNNLMIAYKMNDVVLPPERGFPFELVAESKWGYKWIKWVTEIELYDDPNYRGYWESRGYSNDADLDKSFFN